jgi:V/A-type H+-transporting ATPase subunit A
MHVIFYLYDQALPLVKKNVPISKVKNNELFSKLMRLKNTVANDDIVQIKDFKNEIDKFYQELADNYKN